jgi:hypothetical protein
VDVFDNFVLLKETPGYMMIEPIALVARAPPPVIPDRVKPDAKDAVVQITDIYEGGGLRGIPRGTVKSLRLFTYVYSYHNVGGLLGVLGADGPWDIRRMLGTVPVQPDGSAFFRVPANTPISIQPLDETGPGAGADAQLDDRAAGRKPVLRGLPRGPQPVPAGPRPAWP